jgi:3-methyladenine DNA glycosylase/8-oxoguanine DNA glycosylase
MEPKIGTAAPADPRAKEFLRNADPVMARLIDAHPDFRPRAWLEELPPLDAFGTLVFQVLGQQLSVAATRAILSRLVEKFGGRLPSPAEFLGADAQVLHGSGIQRAYGFDHAPTELEMDQLAERWRPYRSLAVAYLFTSEYDQHAPQVSGVRRGRRVLAAPRTRMRHTHPEDNSAKPAEA